MIYDNASLVQIPSGYKAGTLYSVLPANGDGDFDFTRASIATRVNSQGLIEQVASGVPRLDYPLLNGVVQSCPALLLEPARTNLQLNSEDFSQANWSKTNSAIVTNQLASPDGYVNADKLNETAVNSIHQLESTRTVISSTAYTMSVFAKKAERSWVRIYEDTTAASAYFNLDNGTVGTVGGPASVAKIENYGSGWYRCSVTYTETGTSGRYRIAIAKQDNETSYLGVAGSGIYVWGAQLEAGSYATSYIPTSGSTVTRAAEVCNGAGTSAEFNDSEGVLFAEIAALADDLTVRCISVSSGAYNDSVQIRYHSVSNTLEYRLVDGGVIQVLLRPVVNNILESNKISVKYKENDCSIWVNGFEVGTDISATMPSSLSELAFDDGGGSAPFYGKTKQLIAFDAALTDEQLEDLTSWDSFIEMATEQLYTIE